MFEVDVLVPTVEARKETQHLAPRLGAIEGKVIAALWNGRPQEDAVLRGLLARMESDFGARETRLYRKPALYVSAPDELIAEIVREADGVITGVGT